MVNVPHFADFEQPCDRVPADVVAALSGFGTHRIQSADYEPVFVFYAIVEK